MMSMPRNLSVINGLWTVGHREPFACRTVRGVTLIELLVVLVLIGAVLMVTMPVFSKGVQSLEVRAAARQVYGVLRVARSNAIAQAERSVVLFDDETRQVSLLNSRVVYALPRGVQIDRLDRRAVGNRVIFYADGSSSGIRLALSSSKSNKRYRIGVESLTGQVSVDADNSDISQRL